MKQTNLSEHDCLEHVVEGYEGELDDLREITFCEVCNEPIEYEPDYDAENDQRAIDDYLQVNK